MSRQSMLIALQQRVVVSEQFGWNNQDFVHLRSWLLTFFSHGL
jgi:hypothetical protein